MKSLKKILKNLFTKHIWNKIAVSSFLVILFKLLLFDVIWCYATTFSAFSLPLLWISTLMLALIAAIPYCLCRSRWLQTVVMFSFDIWLICNLMYSRTYYCAIPLNSYGLAGNLADFTSSVTDSLRWIDLLFPVSSIIYILIARSKSKVSKICASDVIKYASYIFMLCILAFAFTIKRGSFNGYYEYLNNANYHSCTTPAYTLAGQLIYEAMSNTISLSDTDKAEVDSWLKKHKQMQALSTIESNKQNVVLIFCESLESWVIGKTIEGKEITPNINRFLCDATINCVYAPNVVSQVGNGRSIDGQLLVNAGMLPPYSKVYSIEHPLNRYYTLNQALKQKCDARSYLLTVDKEDTWNQGVIARAFGFDTIISRDNWINDEPVGAGRKKLGDRSFMRQIVSKMKAGQIMRPDQNSFVQIVTYSGHNPFMLPDSLDELHLTGDYHEIMARYMRLANYTDSGIGLLLDYLKSRPDFDRTMLVITGDHEGLATYRDGIVKTPAGKDFVSDRQLVPLIIINAPQDIRYDGVMGQVDIYPTVLQLMGMSDFEWTGFGYSIANGNHPGIAIGSQGDIQGATSDVDKNVLDHITSARKISERSICFDLLNPDKR